MLIDYYSLLYTTKENSKRELFEEQNNTALLRDNVPYIVAMEATYPPKRLKDQLVTTKVLLLTSISCNPK